MNNKKIKNHEEEKNIVLNMHRIQEIQGCVKETHTLHVTAKQA